MARADYYAIEKGVKVTLEADLALQGVRYFIEEEVTWADSVPAVFIYLDSRDAAPEEQRLAASTRVDYLVNLSLWCIDGHFDSLELASQARSDLVGKVEVALLKDPTLDSSVDYSWLEGGEFMNARDDQSGFITAGEVRLVAKVHATT